MFLPTLDVELARKALILTRNSKEFAVKDLDSARVALLVLHDHLQTEKPSGWKPLDTILMDCWAKLNACETDLREIEEGIDAALHFIPLDD